MTAKVNRTGTIERQADSGAPLTLDDLVLFRVWASPSTRADLQRDVAAIFAHSHSGTLFRRAAELAISRFEKRQWLTDIKGHLEITTLGADAAGVRANGPASSREGWLKVRDSLIGRSLSLKHLSAAQCRAMDRSDGLAALIVQKAYDLNMLRVQSPNALRAQLAVIALERAFGNKIKTGLGKGTGLPGKAGRLLAGQLFEPAREFASDGKLIMAIASDAVDAPNPTAEGLQVALLRRLLTDDPRPLGSSPSKAKTAAKNPTPQKPSKPLAKPTADNDAQPISEGSSRLTAASASRPDLEEFSNTVVAAARPVAEGWPGNRKAFISLVWQAIRHSRPDWELTEVAFKSMLTEAHRSGHVVLAGADLKGRSDMKELEDSKILYKNTVWHFVRVED